MGPKQKGGGSSKGKSNNAAEEVEESLQAVVRYNYIMEMSHSQCGAIYRGRLLMVCNVTGFCRYVRNKIPAIYIRYA